MPTPEELVKQCTSFCSLPEVYLEVKNVIDDPESTMADLSRAISIDPGMSAMVLKLVNSAFYAMPRKVETISRAVGILGMQPLHDLVLSVSVTKSFSGVSQTIVDMKTFWANSFFCGLAARELARQCLLVDSERMFVEGMLQHIGQLVMYEITPEQAEAAIRASKNSGEPIHRSEQHILGFDHTQVGKALIEEWQLPKNLGEAILYQTNPGRTADYGFEAALLNMANALMEGFQAPKGHVQWMDFIAQESWTLTGLNEEALTTAMLEAGKQLSSMLDLMEEAKTAVA